MGFLLLVGRLPMQAADKHQPVCLDRLALTFQRELIEHLDSQSKPAPLACSSCFHTGRTYIKEAFLKGLSHKVIPPLDVANHKLGLQ